MEQRVLEQLDPELAEGYRTWKILEETMPLVKAHQAQAADPRDFIRKGRGMDRTSVEHDLEETLARESNFKRKESRFSAEEQRRMQENKKVSDLLEAMLPQLIQNALKDDATVEAFVPSKYDDYHNHVDLVLTFRRKGGREWFRLAVDMTYATREETRHKFVGHFAGIASGQLGTVKYFREKDEHGKDRYISLTRVPQVTLGLSRTNVLNLAELWKSDKPEDKKALLESPIARALIVEIGEQLNRQYETATEKEKTGAVSRLRSPWNEFYELRKDFAQAEADLQADTVFNMIMNNTVQDQDAMEQMYKDGEKEQIKRDQMTQQQEERLERKKAALRRGTRGGRSGRTTAAAVTPPVEGAKVEVARETEPA